jgi:hypothetical protein
LNESGAITTRVTGAIVPPHGGSLRGPHRAHTAAGNGRISGGPQAPTHGTPGVQTMNSKARAITLLGAGVVAGGILAGTLTANAATSGDTGSSSTSTSSTSTPSAAAPANAFSSTPVRSDEKAVDSALSATLTQKAQAATGGTVYRVETDAGDGTYEAHVKKSDGTLVTVKFDSSGNVTGVEDGMGKGDPAPAGAPTN